LTPGCGAGLSGTPSEGDVCPACKAECEEAKRVIEKRFKRAKDTESVIWDVEEWLRENGGEGGQRHNSLNGT